MKRLLLVFSFFSVTTVFAQTPIELAIDQINQTDLISKSGECIASNGMRTNQAGQSIRKLLGSQKITTGTYRSGSKKYYSGMMGFGTPVNEYRIEFYEVAAGAHNDVIYVTKRTIEVTSDEQPLLKVTYSYRSSLQNSPVSSCVYVFDL